MNWLFPHICPLCGAVAADALCPSCAAFRPPENLRLPLGGGTAVRVLYRYDPEVRNAVYQLKFRRQSSRAEGFGWLIAQCAAADRIDVVTYVPMDPGKQIRRGYNQAERIARSCARALHRPCRKLLYKTRTTQTQHTLPVDARVPNVAGAYRAVPADGLRVLLCDDIVTTGATIRACTHALTAAGAESVQSFCIAWSRGAL